MEQLQVILIAVGICIIFPVIVIFLGTQFDAMLHKQRLATAKIIAMQYEKGEKVRSVSKHGVTTPSQSLYGEKKQEHVQVK